MVQDSNSTKKIIEKIKSVNALDLEQERFNNLSAGEKEYAKIEVKKSGG